MCGAVDSARGQDDLLTGILGSLSLLFAPDGSGGRRRAPIEPLHKTVFDFLGSDAFGSASRGSRGGARLGCARALRCSLDGGHDAVQEASDKGGVRARVRVVPHDIALRVPHLKDQAC